MANYKVTADLQSAVATSLDAWISGKFQVESFIVTEPIFTIGHSDRSLEELIEALREHHLGFVVDVRTSPGSNRHPQFGRNVLETRLPHEGIKYLHLGEELGAFRTEPDVFNSDGQVWYAKVRQLPVFQAGISRIENGAKQGHRIAVMCAEGHPCDCHRVPMIAYQFARDGFIVRHILRDGTLKAHEEIENDLLDRFARKIPVAGLFEQNIGRAEQLEAAYEELNRKIGWRSGSSKHGE